MTGPGCRAASKLWPCAPTEPRVVPGGSAFDGLQPPPSHPAFGFPVLGLEPGPGTWPCSGLTPLLGRLGTSTAHCLWAACCPPAPRPLDPGHLVRSGLHSHSSPLRPLAPSMPPWPRHAPPGVCPLSAGQRSGGAHLSLGNACQAERGPRSTLKHCILCHHGETHQFLVTAVWLPEPQGEWRPPGLRLSVGRPRSPIPALRFA